MKLPLKTRLYYGVGKYLPFLKIRPPQADRKQTMVLRPGRNSVLTWETRDTGETILTVPHNAKVGAISNAIAKWMRVPDTRRVELDEVGSFVWQLCDGNHTIDTIVQKTGQEYKMNRREAEVSVTTFLQMLHERNYIGFYKKVGKSVRGDVSA